MLLIYLRSEIAGCSAIVDLDQLFLATVEIGVSVVERLPSEMTIGEERIQCGLY